MLTRGEVARKIGRSITTVRRMEGERLFPIVDDQGVHWFDEDEVNELVTQIANTGRALPMGAANEALERARRDKQTLVDDLEFALSTIRALREQLLAAQRELTTKAQNKEGPRPWRSDMVRALRDDIDLLIRQVHKRSFQTELVITRIQSALIAL